MKSITISIVVCFFIFASGLSAFGEEWEQTITLSNGDVILDMNGEWATSVEHYGPWSRFGVFPDISEIKQEGASFVVTTLLGSPRSPKGTEKIKGELEKNGFKKAQALTGAGLIDLQGKILENGDKIIFDDGEKLRIMLIRRK